MKVEGRRLTIIFIPLLLALISPTIFVYAAMISAVPYLFTSFVPSMNMTTSGFAELSQPARFVLAMLTAR